jgi:DNA polymerase
MSKKQRDALEKDARGRVAACKVCALHKQRSQTVYGTGSLQARIVFVGEAPGAEEDRTGVPFVGRAGQLLTKMIESIGFTRDEVYICNTVKCRPPDNRDPTPEEKTACRPFLEEQLKILRPQILVGLGAHAAGYLTGLQTSLGKMRSRWHEFEGVPTMVTYHPAFLLRSPGMKKQAWEDLQMLASRYNELNPDDAREVWVKDKNANV